MRKLKRRALLAVGAAGAAALAVSGTLAAAAASATTTGFTASQSVTSRDDSGIQGNNWATDAFARTTHFAARGVVANSNCPGITIGSCHKFTGTLTDNGGTFVTQAGDAPGAGYENGGGTITNVAGVPGTMSGHIAVAFYANVALSKASAANDLGSVSGDKPSTGQWVAQFFPANTEVWDTSGNEATVPSGWDGSSLGSLYTGGSGSWTYNSPASAGNPCPHVTSQWVDASPDWGSLPADGNILAPDASHC